MVGVIGMGVVGSAVYNVFKEKVPTIGFDADESKTKGSYRDILRCDVVFLCLPTPTKKGKQDLSALKIVLDDLCLDGFRGIAVIKSTVLPGTTDYLRAATTFELVHNPEFLSAKTAEQDFRNQNTIILGSRSPQALDRVFDLYRVLFPHPRVLIMSTEDPCNTEMAKYICNVSSAVKVGLFNEFAKICADIGIEYEAARILAVSSVPWLDSMHTRVPGTDGKPGWGGMCFIKDTEAFLGFAESIQFDAQILKAATQENRIIRPSAYDGTEENGLDSSR